MYWLPIDCITIPPRYHSLAMTVIPLIFLDISFLFVVVVVAVDDGTRGFTTALFYCNRIETDSDTLSEHFNSPLVRPLYV